ncbi:MAG: 50S ribosomal protein L18 [Thermoplasmata archaeon]|nr:MAG: 50S ribosomal protein L18 [Thermoplasmata archaeon]RLF70631.1 MAG: 50S ribosomal protein L18 [Thermoplasmata archaeon]RLF72238.1 MAG: 50S ribosomal protein L18 [Thermoplasmata archaeon]RLF74380.1 MAG: 50S ribosomal protein L18 [Thermoplasmata archaeon]HDD59872.1 50S ribosomal protein L18 [Euryarchaeota archaeon]
MAEGPRYHIPFRRRREGKTDYRQRLKLLKSGLPRAVVRITNRKVIIQIAEYHPEGDRIIISALSSELVKMGWKRGLKNIPSAYLTGLLAGKRAVEKGVKKAVLDIGLHVPVKGSRVFAALQGMLDAGLDIPHGEEKLPEEERLLGAHLGENIAEETKKLKGVIMGS